MKRNPVGWFEIYVEDMSRAQKFYEAVLGVTLVKLGDPTDSQVQMMAFPMGMDLPGASGSLVKTEGVEAGANSTLVYFSCSDCAEEGSRVVKSGGRIQRDKMAIGEYGFIVLAIDTEGNMLGLHSMS